MKLGWLTVPAGWLARVYWLVARPKTFGCRVIVHHDRHVLLVRPPLARTWYLPGGLLGRNELFEEGARREVLEEVGIPLGELVLTGVYRNFNEGKRDTVVVFSSELAQRPELALQTGEVSRAEWFPFDALPDRASPATRQRVTELAEGRSPTTGQWVARG